MDNFFHKDILLCDKNHYLSAYCARSIENDEILAIFTLSNDILNVLPYDKDDFIEDSSIEIEEDYQRIYSEQSSYPAININHLAVKKDIQCRHIGRKIISFLVGTYSIYNATGCQFLTVDSLNNPRTNNFYLQNGFQNLSNRDITDNTRRMYYCLNHR